MYRIKGWSTVYGLPRITNVPNTKGFVPDILVSLLFQNVYLNPKSKQDNSPKPLRLAQNAITFGVQVGSSR